MDRPRGHRRTPNDPISEGPAWRPSLGLLAVALGIVAVGLCYVAYGWMSSPSPARVADDTATVATPPFAAGIAVPLPAATAPATAPLSAANAARGSTAVATQRISRVRDSNGDLTPDISDFVNEGERPTMAEVIDRLHAAGVHSGLGAFSPPGIRPPLVGLAVPEDFVLPDGYVRHYQATDDGQRIEPILMFAPDRQFLDAAGRSVEIPDDRVVPPELAPPGLPMRRIVIPPPTESGGRGS